jgi:hypothetical protein
VPFFDDLKIFEMPVAGFFGFPPFAVQCYVMYNFIGLFHSRRNGEQLHSGRWSDGKVSKKVVVLITLSAGAYWALAFNCIDRYTVNSYASLMVKIPSLTTEDVARFHQKGVRSVTQFLDVCTQKGDRENLQMDLGWDEGKFQGLIDHAQLARLRWMGIENALLLRKTGIATIKELAGQSPQDLHRILLETTPSNLNPPSEHIIKIWVRAAQQWQEE